jgi:hypothetical protein
LPTGATIEIVVDGGLPEIVGRLTTDGEPPSTATVMLAVDGEIASRRFAVAWSAVGQCTTKLALVLDDDAGAVPGIACVPEPPPEHAASAVTRTSAVERAVRFERMLLN